MVVKIDEDTLSFVRDRFTEIEDNVNILLFLTKGVDVSAVVRYQK